MTNFSLPTNTTLVSEILQILRERDQSIATMDYSDDTNITSGFIRYNRANRTFEEWDGTTWNEQRLEPAGVVKPFAGTTAPRGHLLCNGDLVNTYTYRALHAVISSTYGGTAFQAGVTDQPSASTTFRLPDLRGRFPLGKAATGTGSTLGGAGGSLNHNHSVPPHYHGMGAGADLNIELSGTHTTSVDISHMHTAVANHTLSNCFIQGNTTANEQISLVDNGHAHNYYAREGGSLGATADRPHGAAGGTNVLYTTESGSSNV